MRTRHPIITAAILLLALLPPAPAGAHPHVWADYWIEAVSGKDGITEFRFTWRFDTMFSQMVRGDLGIRALNAAAIAKIRDQAFANLSKYHYYTYMKLDGKDFLPEQVASFTARNDGEQLVYAFTIPLPRPAQKAEVTIYDEELYVDIGPPMTDDGAQGSMLTPVKPVAQPYVTAKAVAGAKPPACTQQESESRSNPIWGQYKTFTAICTAAP